MTDSDDGDDAFDVLLHDAAQGDEAEKHPPVYRSRVPVRAVRSPRGPWVPWAQAAAALLAIGVVLAISWLRRPPTTPGEIPASPVVQDPVEFKPKTVEELRAFFADVARIDATERFASALSHDRTTLHFSDDEASTWSVTAPAQLARWAGLLQSMCEREGSVTKTGSTVMLWVTDKAGRRYRVWFDLEPDEPHAWLSFAEGGETHGTFLLAEDLVTAGRELLAGIAQRRLETRGVLGSLDELARLPDTQNRLHLQLADTQTMAAALRRFSQVKVLGLSGLSVVEASAPRILPLLRDLPLGRAVESLVLEGPYWTEADLADLQAWPALRSLELHRFSAEVEGVALRALPKLHRLMVHESPGFADTSLPPRLQELAVTPDPGFDVGKVVRSLPALIGLQLFGPSVNDATLGALLQSRLQRLRLLRTQCTMSGLASLRELPSLRTLEVLGAQRDQPAVDALSQLTGIRRLTLWDLPIPDTDLQQLRQALSACRIDGEPNMTPLDNWLLDAELMQREF